MYRAMVVDDEKWTLRGICRTFPWEEFEFAAPESFTDPEEAFERILASPPDVVFVDIRMPVMTGLELMRSARDKGIASEFVILSGLQEFEYARTAIACVAFDYLLKPLHEDAARTLLARLKTHLDRLSTSPRAWATMEQVHAQHVASVAGFEEETQDSFSCLVRYVQDNLAEPLLLKEVAARFFLTPNYVSNLFRTRMDTTYSTYIGDLRIHKARTLLTGTKKSIEEVASLCGYADAQYFSRVFRQNAGMTPMQYRKGGTT